ncbi:MAG: hypothetical protein ACK56F_26840, partial [bacterium]
MEAADVVGHVGPLAGATEGGDEVEAVEVARADHRGARGAPREAHDAVVGEATALAPLAELGANHRLPGAEALG